MPAYQEVWGKKMNKFDFSEYVDRLYSAAVRKTGDSCVAEDIVQETFLAAIGQLKRGSRPEDMWAWLLGILSNKYCDWLREKYKYPRISFEEYPFDIAGEDEAEDDSEEKLEAIRRELGLLANAYREVMVRFYLHGHSLERIAEDLQIPVGTVKSRLNMGRKYVKEGVGDMENYESFSKQSYDPDTLYLSCAGECGLHQEPFSLVPVSDRLSQSILIQAYEKPLTESEIARALGVPAAFVEPVVKKLTEGELMYRAEGGRKVYTNFIIYTDEDRKATFDKQLAVAEEHFPLFWEEVGKGLADLREKTFYQRQKEPARYKLELHFCLKTLMNAYVSVRDEVTGTMPYSEYPYRRDGGRWLAMGNRYSAGRRPGEDKEYHKYGVNGEAGCREKNFRDAGYIELREYGTALGGNPNPEETSQYVKWFYELTLGVPAEELSVDSHVLQDADRLKEAGFLTQGEGRLELNIPVLSAEEYQDECLLASLYGEGVTQKAREVLLPVFQKGHVRLPGHLKSVPKWQQYMYCGDSIPMAVIFQAKEKGVFLKDVDYSLPASLLIFDKG